MQTKKTTSRLETGFMKTYKLYATFRFYPIQKGSYAFVKQNFI
jgi:hypothetical protein